MTILWIKRMLGALLLVALALPALARPFPSNALRGTLTLGYFPDITLNGVARRLAPGARIFNRKNLIEMPGAIGGGTLVVNYTEDSMGNIDRVWILTKEEAQQDLPAPASAPAS